MRPMGPELSRRWLAALALAPWSEREEIVESIERRMAELYAPERIAARAKDASGAKVERAATGETREVRVMLPPRERSGVSEQIIRTYEVPARKAPKANGKEKRA